MDNVDLMMEMIRELYRESLELTDEESLFFPPYRLFLWHSQGTPLKDPSCHKSTCKYYLERADFPAGREDLIGIKYRRHSVKISLIGILFSRQHLREYKRSICEGRR